MSSSPRVRGSSAGTQIARLSELLVPARAGVFRCTACPATPSKTRPRACGGLPGDEPPSGAPSSSSPRVRGSSRGGPELGRRWFLVPARAWGLPRPGVDQGEHRRSSPRVRGSSRLRPTPPRTGSLVPARAGVFRGPGGSHPPGPPRPRACGGLPSVGSASAQAMRSSPRVRGSSVGCVLRCHLGILVPARAGVFLATSPASTPTWPRPRACGGLPSRVPTRQGGRVSPSLHR